jgi:alkylhydroperoxidase/carboxymuconolactone decarboxylase family protein YurZ
MTDNCPELYEQLFEQMGRLGHDIPQVLGAFSQLYKAGMGEGAISAKNKLLTSLGIGIAIRSEGCIVARMHDALKLGATHAEIAETIGVAVVMGGGPSVAYGCKALTALEQFEAEPVPA